MLEPPRTTTTAERFGRGLYRCTSTLAIALLLSCVTSLASADCWRLAGDGLGGTGLSGSDDGIGGTGLIDDAEALRLSDASLSVIDGAGYGEAGRGPGRLQPGAETTGRSWIYGTIAGAGSLCIDGLRVQLPEDTEIEGGDDLDGLAELQVGQVVAVTAREASGRLVATRVRSMPALVGPVTAVDPSGAGLEVMGARVALEPGARCWDADRGAEVSARELTVGELVSIHGLWTADGRVLASHVTRRSDSGAARVRGRLGQRGGRRVVGGVDVELDSAAGDPRAGWVLAAGRWNAATKRMEEARLTSGASVPSGVTRVHLEVLAGHSEPEAIPTPAGLRIEPAGTVRDRLTELAPDTRVWIEITGTSAGLGEVVGFEAAPEHLLPPRQVPRDGHR